MATIDEDREKHRLSQREYYYRNREKACAAQRERARKKRAEKEQYTAQKTVTKEEWLEKYGYPMGDTSGWENWTGWDRRIRRGEDSI